MNNLILFLIFLFAVEFCLAGQRDRDLTESLQGLVGVGYKSCAKYSHGSAITKQGYEKLNHCVTKTYRSGKAFVLSTEGVGIDSYVATGVLGLPNLGGIYRFDYDSSPTGGGCCNYAFGITACHEQTDSNVIDIDTACGSAYKPRPLSEEEQHSSIKKKLSSCTFPGLKLPPDYTVLAGGDYYGGRKLGFELMNTEFEAAQFDVVVNYQQRPVILILAAYEANIWNIAWTDDTRIIGIVVSGFEPQFIAGLPTNIPVLNMGELDMPCGKIFNISKNEEDIKELESLSRKLFNRVVDKIFIANNGNLLIGEPLKVAEKVNTSRHLPPEKFIDNNEPVGLAGIESAVRKGMLRAATQDDINAWVRLVKDNSPSKDIPPIAGEDASAVNVPIVGQAYVILKPFTFPASTSDIMNNIPSATFYVAKGVAMPLGKNGGAQVCDFNTVKCYDLNYAPEYPQVVWEPF